MPILPTRDLFGTPSVNILGKKSDLYLSNKQYLRQINDFYAKCWLLLPPLKNIIEVSDFGY